MTERTISRVPTTWNVKEAVPAEVMDLLRELPEKLPHAWLNEFLYLAWLYDRIENVDGDVVECGLGEGDTFTMLAYMLSQDLRRGTYRELIGFDSFEGWPEPASCDASPRNPKKGEWRVTQAMVVTRLEKSGVMTLVGREAPAAISIVRGFLRDSLPAFAPRSLAFVHLDVDLYEGYRDGLKNLYPMVVPGGIIALDEYREFQPWNPEYVAPDGRLIEKWPGCTKAVDDFLADKPERPQHHRPSGKYYIVKK